MTDGKGYFASAAGGGLAPSGGSERKYATIAFRSLGSIFAYGVFFGLLYHWSGSLYAPLICHLLNNLVTSSMGL